MAATTGDAILATQIAKAKISTYMTATTVMLITSPHAPVDGRLGGLRGLDGGADVGRGEVLAPAEAVLHLLLRLGNVLVLLLDAQELAVAVQLPAGV